MRDIINIGLTGAMGAGKSAAMRVFEELGAWVFDADKLAHKVLEGDENAKAKTRELLGDETFDAEGRPIRPEIAKKVFSDKTLLKGLEQILHPAVREMWKNAPADGCPKPPENGEIDFGRGAVKVVEIPLLFEKKLENDFEICVTVHCSSKLRMERLINRGMSPQQIAARDALQLPPLLKAKLADVVLFNESDLGFLKKQAARVLSRVLKQNRQ